MSGTRHLGVRFQTSPFGTWLVPVTESLLLPPQYGRSYMDQSYFREQADKARRLARDSTDPVLQASLRRLADDYQMRADELENDEICAKGVDPND